MKNNYFPCFTCHKPMKIMNDVFHHNGRSFKGLVCKKCNVKLDYPYDSYEAATNPDLLTESKIWEMGFIKSKGEHDINTFWKNSELSDIFGEIRIYFRPKYGIHNPNYCSIRLYHKEHKNIPAPCNDDLNRTIDIPAQEFSIASHITSTERLKSLIFGLTGKKL